MGGPLIGFSQYHSSKEGDQHNLYRTVTVIGLGSLGGFLCKNISELDSVRRIILVDDDIVESKNIFKSIYRSFDIGESKVDALYNIINDDVAVTKIKQKYFEGDTRLPKSDLVIDCRDIICDRGTEIDAKFYITDKTLVVDCRQNVNCLSQQGFYSVELTKNEIKKAAFYATQIIDSGHIKNMLSNNLIQNINLSVINDLMENSINETLSNQIDLIYDEPNVDRLHCFQENIKPILTLNRHQDLDIFIGNRNATVESILNFPDKTKLKHAIVPKGKLTNSNDVMSQLNKLILKQPGVSKFIITIRKKGGIEYVELLEETGAA